ncbi:MAG TPA: penicillin-binding transpeptidase domain-containing protein [Solirubrobacteraceae bacterium]|nr:penicillin-binding transpeptidase domain-containing protein [Solirubrobacteraceae bacterium]
MLTRALPAALLVALLVAGGAYLLLSGGGSERRLVRAYVTAWTRSDVPRMYALLDAASRREMSEPQFSAALGRAASTATMTGLRVLRIGNVENNAITVRMRVDTRVWGPLHENLTVPLSGVGSDPHVHFGSVLLFPGLAPHERLHRTVTLPPRGTLLASDGTPLAQGPARTSPIPDVAVLIVGTVGPIPSIDAAYYRARGYPAHAQVGLDGLERIFEARLVGREGGALMAGRRRLATARAVQAPPVRTTISPGLERAANAAMGGHYAGMVVLNPRTGAMLAAVGIAFTNLQPPGSTMKIVTASAVLTAGIARLSTVYPVQTAATLSGFQLQNANGESCGGTLLNAFAVSCNSVFAPLGARLGARRLVAMAERFGFNQPLPILGAAEPSIPSASAIGDDLAVGSSAIGQGLVQATPLTMADVAATIAMGGRRPIPTLLAGQKPRFVRVISGRVAHEVQTMMIAVVNSGTGTGAQIPGVTVAGKTGTAELRNTTQPGQNTNQNTDAWFVGYAPVGHPRYVVAALFPNQGAGGSAAAPPVGQVLSTALHSH